MNDPIKSQTDSQTAKKSPTLIVGLSRRKALKVLVQGVVGGLLVEAAHVVPPAQAQSNSTFLPLVAPGLTPTDDDDLEMAAIDFTWFRTHLVNEILPKWLAARTTQGLFLPHFNRQWQPLNRNFGTLVSQGRLLYNFAQGYAVTGEQRYRDAVAAGAHYLLDHFRDAQYGGWYWSVNLDGTARDKRKDSYGHAFVIFGLAHAFQCTGNTAFRDAMLQTWDVVKTRFSDSYGGYIRLMTQDFKVTGTTKEQNPMMHLFEALLAAGTVGGQAQLKNEARTIGNWVLDELVRPKDRRLPEEYDMQWQEAPYSGDASGGRLDIGHAFEWAYLASYGAELGLGTRFLTYANNFLTYGMALGFDWQNGGIYSPAKPNGEIINQEKGWWEQTEAIRALTHFYLRHRRNDLNGPLQKALEFVKAQFIDAQYGGWYPRIGPGINPQTLEKGNEWKLDYHVVGMCMEAIRLVGQVVTE